LVVIAIIAILAAILFPVFAKAREKARTNTCMNNQRQIAIAMTMYVQDHAETFIRDTGTNAWSSLLKDYNEPTIYDCPTKTGQGSNTAPEYGFNGKLFGKALGDVPNPVAAVLTADLSKDNPPPNYALKDYDVDLDARHNKGLVLTCVDGHVAYESFNNVSGSKFVALGNRGYDFFPVVELVSTLAGPYSAQQTAANMSARVDPFITIPSQLLKDAEGNVPDIRVELEMNETRYVNDYVAYGFTLFDPGTTPVTQSSDSWLQGVVPFANCVFTGGYLATVSFVTCAQTAGLSAPTATSGVVGASKLPGYVTGAPPTSAYFRWTYTLLGGKSHIGAIGPIGGSTVYTWSGTKDVSGIMTQNKMTAAVFSNSSNVKVTIQNIKFSLL